MGTAKYIHVCNNLKCVNWLYKNQYLQDFIMNRKYVCIISYNNAMLFSCIFIDSFQFYPFFPSKLLTLLTNTAKYNNFISLIYRKVWSRCPKVCSVNRQLQWEIELKTLWLPSQLSNQLIWDCPYNLLSCILAIFFKL